MYPGTSLALEKRMEKASFLVFKEPTWMKKKFFLKVQKAAPNYTLGKRKPLCGKLYINQVVR